MKMNNDYVVRLRLASESKKYKREEKSKEIANDVLKEDQGRRCFPRYNRVTVDIKFPIRPSWDDLHVSLKLVDFGRRGH